MSALLSATFQYAINSVVNAVAGWNSFWFQPKPSSSVGIARVGIGIWAFIYVLSWWRDMAGVILQRGLFNTELTRYLIGSEAEGTGSQGRLSALYYVESPWSVQLYLIATAVMAFLLILGLGGRAVAALTTVLVLGITHRLPMVQGFGELAMSSMLVYLVIDTGRGIRASHVGIHDGQLRVSANLALRLLQVHVLLWLIVSFVSTIAEEMWWNGSAVWWLAIAERSPVWGPKDLADKPYWVNIISHLYLVLHAMVIVCLCRRGWRPWGLLAGACLAILAFLIAGDWMYSFSLVCALFVFGDAAIGEVKASAQLSDAKMMENEASRGREPELLSPKGVKREAKRAMRSR